MTSNGSEWSNTLVHLLALAAKLEGEGQYNLAKLSRCAADAACRQAAYEMEMPSNQEELAAEIAKGKQ